MQGLNRPQGTGRGERRTQKSESGISSFPLLISRGWVLRDPFPGLSRSFKQKLGKKR